MSPCDPGGEALDISLASALLERTGPFAATITFHRPPSREDLAPLGLTAAPPGTVLAAVVSRDQLLALWRQPAVARIALAPTER